MSEPLTEAEVQQFAADWYRALDVHAPMVDLLPMIAGDDLEMQLPEGVRRGNAGFEEWYQTVIRLFFDESHAVKEAKLTSTGDPADVSVVVNWQASRWNPPAAQSDRINADAYQRWVVRRSAETGKPEIVTYIVDDLKYLEGSAEL